LRCRYSISRRNESPYDSCAVVIHWKDLGSVTRRPICMERLYWKIVDFLFPSIQFIIARPRSTRELGGRSM
jgi:hypothetical protein